MNSELGTVLVTGGASGLGAALADAVEAAGGRPFVLDRRAPRDGIDHELVDLADSKETEHAVRQLCDDAPDLTAVVTCAGVDVPGRL